MTDESTLNVNFVLIILLYVLLLEIIYINLKNISSKSNGRSIIF